MPSLDDKSSRSPATQQDERGPRSTGWKHPLYHSGFLQGMGLGLILAVIAVQLPTEMFGRYGAAAFLVGTLLLIVGAWRFHNLPM